MFAQQLLHTREALIFDDAGQPLVTRAIGDTRRAAFGHVDLIAGTLRQSTNEAVEVRRLPHRHARRGRAFGKAGIVGLPPLFADPRRRTGAAVPDLALGIELARALREIVACGLARAPIDAGALARRLGRRAVCGPDLYGGVIGFQRSHHLRFVAAGCAGELGDGGGTGFARESVDEGDAARGFLDGEAEHGGGIALAFVTACPVRLLGRDVAPLDRRHIVAREISPTFHRTNLDLRCRQIVAQHLLLIECVGDQLGEGWIGRRLRDHGRGFERRILLVIAIALEMPLRA